MKKLIAVVTILLVLSKYVKSIEFVFQKGRPKTYSGYLWKNSVSVYIKPRIQLKVDASNAKSICSFHVYSLEPSGPPFYLELVDSKHGFADLRIKPTSQIDFSKEHTIVFEASATDCSDPPTTSERVLFRVHVLSRHGPVFDKPHYAFTIGQQNPIGSVVGQIQAIEERNTADGSIVSSICNYRIRPAETPFSIDGHGVIRVREILPSVVKHSHVFQVVAEDCTLPVPLRTVVDVMVEQTSQDCQPGWKNFPKDIEYRGTLDKAERLFWPPKMYLETCSGQCANLHIKSQLELKSALDGQTLVTAHSEACRHDPVSLIRQRKICDVRPGTLTNLLPRPEQDIASQLVGPALGNQPRLTAPTMTWVFDSSLLTTWQIDPNTLKNGDGDALPNYINQFDTDFSISFWLRHMQGRNAQGVHQTHQEDLEEAVLCSQDEQHLEWRYFSISFYQCQLIFRLLGPLIDDQSRDTYPSHFAKLMWTTNPLPQEICSKTSSQIWHHYAISFSRTPWSGPDNFVTIIIDGQDYGLSISKPMQTVIGQYAELNRVTYKPKITVGSCFDTYTHLTRQHLNGELAGLTLLLGNTESPSVLRCTAQCGEALLIPDVLTYLRPDIDINLESHLITIKGQSLEHVTDVLTAIAYARPQPGISPDYVPDATQSRLLQIITEYQCGNEHSVVLPTSVIELRILPVPTSAHVVVDSTHLTNSSSPASRREMSKWVPTNLHILDGTLHDPTAVQSQASENRPPNLIILGSDIATMEWPIGTTGVPIFADVQFGLPNEKISDSPGLASRTAALIPIDECLIWPLSLGKPTNLDSRPHLDQNDGPYINWPIADVKASGLVGVADNTSVRLRGRLPAGDYARLLQHFYLIPPNTISPELSFKTTGVENNDKNVLYIATIGLICSMEGGKQTTPIFTVKLIIQSDAIGNVNEQMSNNYPISEVNGPAQLVKSHKERRPFSKNAFSDLRQIGPLDNGKSQSEKFSQMPSNPRLGLIIGLSLSASIVVIIIIIISVWLSARKKLQPGKKRTGHGGFTAGAARAPRNGYRGRFAKPPADFGGASLKMDPMLRFTTNPLNEYELLGIASCRRALSFTSNTKLGPSSSIYSPPSTRKNVKPSVLDANKSVCDNTTQPNTRPCTLARLAGLEEFDGQYVMEDMTLKRSAHISDLNDQNTKNTEVNQEQPMLQFNNHVTTQDESDKEDDRETEFYEPVVVPGSESYVWIDEQETITNIPAEQNYDIQPKQGLKQSTALYSQAYTNSHQLSFV